MTGNEIQYDLFDILHTAPQTVGIMREWANEQVFSWVFEPEELRQINRVVLTGDGEGFFAALALQPLFAQAFDQPGIRVDVENCLNFAQYYDTYRRFWLEDKNAGPNRVSALVCCVSILGEGDLPLECMKKTAQHGGVPVAFTSEPQSRFAKAAKYAIPLRPSPSDHLPGMKAYIASVYSLAQFALYSGMVRGRWTSAQIRQRSDAVQRYAAGFTPQWMHALGQQAEELARRWYNAGVNRFELLGDGPDLASAHMGEWQIAKTFGGLAQVNNTDDWRQAYVPYTVCPNIATVIFANLDSPSFSCACEAAHLAAACGRQVMVVTDATPGYFPQNTQVFIMPRAPEPWAGSMLQPLPIGLVAAHFAQHAGRLIPDAGR